MLVYKLTEHNRKTHNNTFWGEHVTHQTYGNKYKRLCTEGYLHFYESPVLAAIMNMAHGDFARPILWEAEADGEIVLHSDKGGCTKLTTIKRIPLPEVTLEQRVTFAILATKQICSDTKWNTWADNWLNGTDRSSESANVIRDINTTHAARSLYNDFILYVFLACRDSAGAAYYADGDGFSLAASRDAAHAIAYAAHAAKNNHDTSFKKLDIKSILNQVFPKR